LNTTKPEEEHRNRFDRFTGYYRWTWLISKMQGATTKEHPLPIIAPDGKQHLHVEILPSQRGASIFVVMASMLCHQLLFRIHA